MTGIVFIAVLAASLTGLMGLAGVEISGPELSLSALTSGEDKSLARFEPSSPAVVEEMLDLAEVAEDDVVYDLGCGDGRIVIAAAKTRGARGVGVDIDPELISESRRNAEKAQVSHLVQFIREDLVSTDMSRATVVMLYLLPDANLLLRPRLLSELQPGSRVVSHSHDMGEWKPDRESLVNGHHVYAWTVPADVSGQWKLDISDKYAPVEVTAEISQRFQEITLLLTADGRKIPVKQAELNGKELSFTADTPFGSLHAPIVFRGTVGGDAIRGTFLAEKSVGSWTAGRKR